MTNNPLVTVARIFPKRPTLRILKTISCLSRRFASSGGVLPFDKECEHMTTKIVSL